MEIIEKIKDFFMDIDLETVEWKIKMWWIILFLIVFFWIIWYLLFWNWGWEVKTVTVKDDFLSNVKSNDISQKKNVHKTKEEKVELVNNEIKAWIEKWPVAINSDKIDLKDKAKKISIPISELKKNYKEAIVSNYKKYKQLSYDEKKNYYEQLKKIIWINKLKLNSFKFSYELYKYLLTKKRYNTLYDCYNNVKSDIFTSTYFFDNSFAKCVKEKNYKTFKEFVLNKIF